LESLTFNTETPVSWKIVYQPKDVADPNTDKLIEKITKFIDDRSTDRLTFSTDIYTIENNFIVIHGFKSQESASNAAVVLKEIKEYKVTETAYIISNENYKIVQMKKLFPEYVTENWITKPIEVKDRTLNSTTATTDEKNTSVTKEAVKNALDNVKPESKKATSATNEKSSNPALGDMNTNDVIPGMTKPLNLPEPIEQIINKKP
jgi:hypothetical protein